MLVKGHSGFGIELVDETTIRKSAADAGAERLKRQIGKQSLFHATAQCDQVRTPKILCCGETSGSFHADMEFIAAKDFVQFLSEADRRTLDDFLGVIVSFVQRNLVRCEIREISSLIRGKLDELARRGVPEKYVHAARSMAAGAVHIPVGPCHGDLTLSNILFKSDHLYLLDFLDCYVESPLQDIVKLRQDTRFGWSLHLYQADFNWPKVQIALRYLDRHIEHAFQANDWYRRHYDLFQFVNLARVLPYCTEARLAALITGNLDQMLNNSVA